MNPLRKYFRGGFSDAAQARLFLGGSTATAYLITFATAPLFSRAYPVAYFGVAAVISMAVTLLLSFSTLQLHMAVHALPTSRAAAVIIIGSCLIATVVSAAVLLGIILAHDAIVQFLGVADARMWLWVIPLNLLLGSISLSLDQWLTRIGSYRVLAKANIVHAATGTVLPLALLWTPELTNPIILGITISTMLASLYRVKHAQLAPALGDEPLTLQEVLGGIRANLRFARDVLPSGIINGLVRQLPVTVLGREFGENAVAHYARAQTLLGLPISVGSNTFRTTFMNEAGTAYRESGNCRPIFIRTFWQLLLLNGLFYAAMAVQAPTIFSWFYGHMWLEAGHVAQTMSGFYLFAAIASPLGSVLYFGRNTRWELAWQVLLLLAVWTALIAGARSGSMLTAVALYALAYSAMYVLYLVLSYVLSVATPNDRIAA